MMTFLLGWLGRLSPWLLIASLAYAAAFIEMKVDQSPLERQLVESRDRFYGGASKGDFTWFVGGEGVVLQTPDAGLSWERIDLPGRQNMQATAVSPDGVRVIVGNQGRVYAQQILAGEWTGYNLPVPDWAGKLLAVEFFDDHFWIVGEAGALFRLNSLGLEWTDLSLDEDLSLNGLARSDDGRYWIAAEFGTLLFSADGGQTWERQILAEESLRQVHFRNGQAVAVGNRGLLLASTDSGETWQTHAAITTDHLFDVIYFDGRWLASADQGQVFAASEANGPWEPSLVSGIDKTYFTQWVPTSAGLALAGQRLGLVSNGQWQPWPTEEIE